MDGTEILRATLCYPAGLPLAEALICRAEAWIVQTLAPGAEHAFASDPDPSKRFRFKRFEYRLCISATPLFEDVCGKFDAKFYTDAAQLCIEATLDRGGTRLLSEQITRDFRVSDGALLPPREVAKIKKHPNECF